MSEENTNTPLLPTKAPFEGIHPFFQVAAFLLWIVFGTLIFGGLATILTPILFNTSQGIEWINQPDMVSTHISATAFLQIISTGVGTFLFPASIMLWLLTKQPIQYLNPRPQISMLQIGIVLGLLISAIYSLDIIQQFNEWILSPEIIQQKFTRFINIHERQILIQNAFLDFDTPAEFLWVFLALAVFPAVGEELAFRGVLYNIIHRNTQNATVAIVASSIIFGLLHFEIYYFLPITCMGMLLGYIYYLTKNILIPIFAHFLNNAIIVSGAALYNFGVIETNMMEIEHYPLWIGIVAMLAFLILFFFSKKIRKPESKNTTETA